MFQSHPKKTNAPQKATVPRIPMATHIDWYGLRVVGGTGPGRPPGAAATRTGAGGAETGSGRLCGSIGSGVESGDASPPPNCECPQAGQKTSSDHTGARHWGLAQGRNSPTGATGSGGVERLAAGGAGLDGAGGGTGAGGATASGGVGGGDDSDGKRLGRLRHGIGRRNRGLWSLGRRGRQLRPARTAFDGAGLVCDAAPLAFQCAHGRFLLVESWRISRWPASDRDRPPGGRQRCSPR